MCVAATTMGFFWIFKLISLVTFVDETKGLASNSEYESFSEYATPPPDTRSTDATSAFSTPIADFPIVRKPEHTLIQPLSAVTSHGIGEPDQSPSVIQPLTSPFGHQLWEEHSASNRTDLSQETLPLFPSPNPLTIEGILNKNTADSAHQQVQSCSPSKASTSIPPIYSDRPVWPLADPAEALLLRHFVQNLATWVRQYQILVTSTSWPPN
jgi:hypothetical protein